MHSPKDAAGSSFQLSQRANHFSFPPTQRFGLLGSPTAFSSFSNRSRDQRTNLQRSYRNLLTALSTSPWEHAPAQ